MLNTIEMANDYFSTNFYNKTFWATISDDDKTLLLETAENDINAYLGTVEIDESVINEVKPYTAYQLAVFEWAVFISKNKDLIESNITERAMGLNSVTVEGVGTETKAQTSSKYDDVFRSMISKSPASKYLKMIYKDVRILR